MNWLHLPLRISQTRDTYVFVLMALLLKGILSVFVFTMTDTYAYYGVIFKPRDFEWQLISNLSFIVVAWLVDTRVDRASNVLHFLLFLFCYLPISVEHDMNSGREAMYYWLLTMVFIAIPILRSRLQDSGVSHVISLEQYQFFFISLVFIGGLLAVIVASYGVSLKLPSFNEIYDQRAEFKEGSSRISQYAFNWLGNALNVGITLYGLSRKRIWIVCLGLLLSVYLFSLGGHKAILLAVPLAIFISTLYRWAKPRFIIALMAFFTTAFLLLLLIDLGSGETSIVSSILVRRGMLLPAQIYYHYGTYFADGPYNFFSHSFPFSEFIESPYREKIPSIIGAEFFKISNEVYANGNVFADTMAQLGLWAFPFLTVVLSLLYAFVDQVSYSKPGHIYATMTFVSGFTLANSGLIVGLITHGMLLGLLVIAFYPTRRYFLTKV